jgi:hypothetical protein
VAWPSSSLGYGFLPRGGGFWEACRRFIFELVFWPQVRPSGQSGRRYDEDSCCFLEEVRLGFTPMAPCMQDRRDSVPVANDLRAQERRLLLRGLRIRSHITLTLM